MGKKRLFSRQITQRRRTIVTSADNDCVVAACHDRASSPGESRRYCSNRRSGDDASIGRCWQLCFGSKQQAGKRQAYKRQGTFPFWKAVLTSRTINKG